MRASYVAALEVSVGLGSNEQESVEETGQAAADVA